MSKNPSIAQQVMNLTDPKKMIELGANLPNFNVREWNDVYDEKMKLALRHKFSDPAAKGARESLLATKKRTIGEASRHNYWGTGLIASDPNALDPYSWTGGNTLGVYLMAIRDQIEEEMKEAKSTNKGALPPGMVANEIKSLNSTDSESDKSKPINYALVFGDGNVPNSISKDLDLPLKVINQSKGEMKLTDVQEEINKCMVPKEDVEFIVVHLGSCHWHENENVSEAGSVFKELENAVSALCSAFPKAEFVLSEVPYRDPEFSVENADKLKEINAEILKYNEKLAALARSERTISVAENQNILISEKLPPGQPKHYENSTQLNEEGRCILLDNLKRGIAEAIKINIMSGDGSWQQQKKHGRKAAATNPHTN